LAAQGAERTAPPYPSLEDSSRVFKPSPAASTRSVVPALAVGATCIGEGVSFDCAVGLASRATMFPVRRLIDQAVPRYVLDEDLAGPIATFGKRLAGLFLKGTTSAGTMLRREK